MEDEDEDLKLYHEALEEEQRELEVSSMTKIEIEAAYMSDENGNKNDDGTFVTVIVHNHKTNGLLEKFVISKGNADLLVTQLKTVLKL